MTEWQDWMLAALTGEQFMTEHQKVVTYSLMSALRWLDISYEELRDEDLLDDLISFEGVSDMKDGTAVIRKSDGKFFTIMKFKVPWLLGSGDFDERVWLITGAEDKKSVLHYHCTPEEFHQQFQLAVQLTKQPGFIGE